MFSIGHVGMGVMGLQCMVQSKRATIVGNSCCCNNHAAVHTQSMFQWSCLLSVTDIVLHSAL